MTKPPGKGRNRLARFCANREPGMGAGRSGGDEAYSEEPVYAALDLGTNNCRMLIARPHEPVGSGRKPGHRGPDYRVIDSFSRITRLGEGLAASGVLSRHAQDRTIEALKRCAEKMDRRGVTQSRHVTTEACRRATNGPEFVERVREEAGVTLECISAVEEARLALAGCAELLDHRRPHALVFDIGGGSTELMWVSLSDSPFPCVEGFATLPLGVVTVSEECGGGDLTRRTYEAVVDYVRAQLHPFEERHRIASQIASGMIQMLGTSGTVTTLGGLHLGLPRYDRTAVDGLSVSFQEISHLCHSLSAMTHRQRAETACIGPSRADLVLAGCAILEAICQTWPVGSLTVADRGLREGMLIDLMRPALASRRTKSNPFPVVAA